MSICSSCSTVNRPLVEAKWLRSVACGHRGDKPIWPPPVDLDEGVFFVTYDGRAMTGKPISSTEAPEHLSSSTAIPTTAVI